MTPPEVTGRKPASSLRLLSFKDLKSVKGIPYSRSEIRRKEKAGTFPMHVTLGDGNGACIAWPESEVDDYIRARMAARVS
jgi:predicted DNA-binding transcriptional regulator AlpA